MTNISARMLALCQPIALTLFFSFFLFQVSAAAGQAVSPNRSGSPTANPGLYMKVLLPAQPKISRFKPGDVIQGTLAADVYSADRKTLSSGDQVRLTVDHLEKRKRSRTDHWPGVINLLTPRNESYPIFRNATVSHQNRERFYQVSMIAARRLREVLARGKQSARPENENGSVVTAKSNAKQKPPFTMVLEAADPDQSRAGDADTEAVALLPTNESLPIGTRLKILLLGNTSASRSKPGDAVEARLLEPVMLNANVALPAGSLLEGKVLKTQPPRMLSRAGSLYLTFTNLTIPAGRRFELSASPAGAELDARSHTEIDTEGRMRGEHPGKAWMAINLGVTAGVAKVADDTLQLIIEAIVSTATDASTAGVGRIASAGASAIYLATRHGRDVVLPRFTEMEVSLDRPLSLDPGHSNQMPAASGAGK